MWKVEIQFGRKVWIVKSWHRRIMVYSPYSFANTSFQAKFQVVRSPGSWKRFTCAASGRSIGPINRIASLIISMFNRDPDTYRKDIALLSWAIIMYTYGDYLSRLLRVWFTGSTLCLWQWWMRPTAIYHFLVAQTETGDRVKGAPPQPRPRLHTLPTTATPTPSLYFYHISCRYTYTSPRRYGMGFWWFGP